MWALVVLWAVPGVLIWGLVDRQCKDMPSPYRSSVEIALTIMLSLAFGIAAFAMLLTCLLDRLPGTLGLDTCVPHPVPDTAGPDGHHPMDGSLVSQDHSVREWP